MVGFSSYILILALLSGFLLPGPTFAGEFENKCRQAGDSAKSACKGAVDAAKAGDSSQSGAIAAGSGNAVNPNAGNLGQGISGQQGRLNQAQSACQAAKQKCTSTCDQAQQKAQSTPDPQTKKPPHSDAQKIPGTKQSSCIAPIESMLGELGKAQDNLSNDKQASEATKNASQGGAPPGGGKSGGGDDKKDQGQNQNPSAQLAGGIDCNTSDGARYSDCNEKLVEKCKNSMGDSTCVAFGTRYCGSVSSGQSSSVNTGGILRPAFSSTNTSGMVVDKSGEGLGSSYCKTYSAYKFCQQSGRGACPSCVNLQASNSPTCISSPEQCMGENSSEVLDRARKECPSDPLFSDPSVQRNAGAGTTTREPSNTSGSLSGSKNGTSGSAAGIGFGGHGSGSAATNGPGASAGPDLEYGQAPGGAHSNAGVSEGGGGGGGGYSSDQNSSEIDPFKVQSADGKAGKPHAGGAANGSIPADVAKEFGPSLFSISTSTYQSLCQKQRLNCRN